MGSKIYKHICKNYHLYSFIANSLNAFSMAGLFLLGAITDSMTVAWLVGCGLLFACLFFIGKLLDQEIEDMNRVKEHDCESNCNLKE